MKPREFWMPASDLQQYNGCTYNMGIITIHVREVIPEREAAIDKMVEILEWLHGRPNICPKDVSTVMSEWRKVNS